MLVVADAGPLIALADLGHLPILVTLYVDVRLPGAVDDEVFSGGRRARPGWLRVERPAGSGPAAGRRGLGSGEREAIALAVEIHADLLLADDRRAREAAEAAGLQVVGTLGVLLAAKRRRLLPRLRPLLDALRATGFRLSDRVYRSGLAQAGEAEES